MIGESGRLQLAASGESDALRDEVLLAKCVSAFDQTRDTRFFFPGQQTGRLLQSLVELSTGNDMAIGVVTSEPGCGKTMLRSELQRHLAEQGYACAALESGWLDFDGIIMELTSQLEGKRVESTECPDRYSRMAALKDALVRHVVRHDHKLIVLADEAQQLSAEAVEGLRSLTNISAERKNYVSVVFFGQPEFGKRIASDRSVMSRVTVNGRLDPFDASESAAYIRHRVRQLSGTDASLFTADALARLHQVSGGVPRIINQHCKLALEACLRKGRQQVDSKIIEFTESCPDQGGSWPDSCLLTG
jgi:type II secretory pathway predicted ATPase ExeA